MNNTILAIVVTLSLLANADAATKKTVSVGRLSPEERKARHEANRLEDMKSFGGYCVVPGSQKGCIRIVNAQKLVTEDAVEPIFKQLRGQFKYNASIVSGNAVDANTAPAEQKRLKADVAIFLVNDATSANPLLIAPEGHWAIINVAKLAEGNPAPSFVASRVRKEIMRAFGYMTAASSAACPLLDPVKDVAELDGIGVERLPADVIMRQRKYLKAMSVSGRSEDTYENILILGYNVQPTNEYQKAIWDKVHQLPTKPLPLVKPTK